MSGRFKQIWWAAALFALSGVFGCGSSDAAPECGDGNVDEGEVCDDSNNVDGDGCSADCLSDETCGNDIVDSGEACDDGNTDDGDGCSANCLSDETCGNNFVDPGEACDDGNDDPSDGCLSTCEVPTSCLQIITTAPSSTSGAYVIDPDGPDGESSFDAFCDMETDGGGWTLLSWTGDSTTAVGTGVPYPGLIPCATLDCLRGSAMGAASAQALIEISGEFGLGHDTATTASYLTLGAYTYAGTYDYGSLSGLLLNYGVTTCGGTAGASFATGTFSTLAGPADYDGTTVYVSQGLAYASYDFSDDANSYIFSLGVTSSYCNGSGTQPGSYLGTYFSPTGEKEYGPYLGSTDGSRSVWLR